MKNFESPPINQKQKEKPEWVQNLRIAYGAWKNDDKAMQQELGERGGDLMGDIDRELYLEVATIFYNQIGSMHDLPSFVPLEQDSEYMVNADVDIEHNSLKFSRHFQPTERKYYLPQTHELYIELPLATNPEKRKYYLPESESFKGFEEIKKEIDMGAGGSYAAFYSFYDLTPPLKDDLAQESRALRFQFGHIYSGAENQEYQRARSSQEMRDRYGLSPAQIDEIIVYLEGIVKDEGDRKKLEVTRGDIHKTLDAFPEKLNRAKEKNVGHIRQRIANLTNFLLENFTKDLPESIDIMHTEYDEDHQKIAEYFYMPHEKKLIRVPYKKASLSGKLKLNFSKAEDAPEEEWLNVGLLGDMLLDMFPYDIRDNIKNK